VNVTPIPPVLAALSGLTRDFLLGNSPRPLYPEWNRRVRLITLSACEGRGECLLSLTLFAHPYSRAFRWNGSENADYAALVSDCLSAKV
jgi:hypothetical protein